ncbi:MAG: hypothetical protein WC209_09395 [Ignavibacteriaceae bacterium]|jgi:hypothetical protein
MKKNRVVFLLMLISIVSIRAQQIGKGTATEQKSNVHDGNRVKTVFSNWGVIAQPGTEGPAGGWKYVTNKYVGDVSPLVGVSLPVMDYNADGKIDTLYSIITTNVTGHGDGDMAPGNTKPWTFEPIPGFANERIAMSHQPGTWPLFWPDQPKWVDEKGHAEWNGYFGRGQMNADQESYFMMDDNCDEKFYTNYKFIPDSTDPSRRGQAIRVAARGLQWADFLAQDVIFWLYEITNIGTTVYNQAVFGALVGTYVGLPGNEYLDDASFFNVRENITYSWDYDHYVNPSANPLWQGPRNEVGYIAYSFLESPGNKYDGIDNDGDSRGNDPYFTADDFNERTIHSGQKLILIDRNNYQRSEFIMPNYTINVGSLGKTFRLVPDSTILAEGNLDKNGALNKNAYDGYDNDLDGLIDENYQLHYRQYKIEATTKKVLIDTLNPLKYTSYLSNLTKLSQMIDEARDDGIDNDNDWSKDITGKVMLDEHGNLIDDTGKDGKLNTNDEGEKDGIPTLGESNFDKTDVDESDQIGLTSFHYFVPSNDINLGNENDMWRRMKPGTFDVPTSVQNNVATRGEDGDFIYGSGYFPLLPGATERFSLAFSFGEDYPSTIKTKKVAQTIYNANYNFPKPPNTPTLTATPGDRKVILYWDKVAENSIDPVSRENDFEGYMIYKSTDPNFNDIMTVTDKDGNPKRYKSLKQFDLQDNVKGIFVPSQELMELRNGVPFYLGEETGIQNTYIDEDVKNGVTYFYAVCAYDKGLAEKNIFPAENSHIISVDINGNYSPGINCAVVIPNAPVAGYIPPKEGEKLTRVSGNSKAIPYYSIVDPTKVKSSGYQVSFIDSLQAGIPIAYAYSVKDITTGEEIYKKNLYFKQSNNDVFDGVTLHFDTRFQNGDSVKADVENSFWNNNVEKNLRFSVQPFNFVGYPKGVRETESYAIVFGAKYDKQSTANLLKLPVPAKKTNMEIFNISNPSEPRKLPFAYITLDTILSKGDRVMLATADTTSFTWTVEFAGDSTKVPTIGDTLFISINRPFSSKDVFSFITKPSYADKDLLSNQMSRIKVVPNPYVVSNIFEHPLPGDVRGRGDRAVKFIHIPANSKISIYTSRGNLVKEIIHDGNLDDGTVTWDLTSTEGLDVAYGIYFYIVEDPISGAKKTGKIALIK